MDGTAALSGDRLRSIILLVVLAVAVGIFVLYQVVIKPDSSSIPPLVAVGRPAPDFALPNLSGEIVRLSDFRGKIVFLNIWATWCSPCREEMPSMEKLYQEMNGQPFEILAVSIDILGAKAVAPFMKELKLTFPALLNPEGTISRLYSTTGVPETFIIDKNGIISAKIIGARDWASPDAVKAFKELTRNAEDELRGTRSPESRSGK